MEDDEEQLKRCVALQYNVHPDPLRERSPIILGDPPLEQSRTLIPTYKKINLFVKLLIEEVTEKIDPNGHDPLKLKPAQVQQHVEELLLAKTQGGSDKKPFTSEEKEQIKLKVLSYLFPESTDEPEGDINPQSEFNPSQTGT